jgi:hypothetical protein
MKKIEAKVKHVIAVLIATSVIYVAFLSRLSLQESPSAAHAQFQFTAVRTALRRSSSIFCEQQQQQQEMKRCLLLLLPLKSSFSKELQLPLRPIWQLARSSKENGFEVLKEHCCRLQMLVLLPNKQWWC